MPLTNPYGMPNGSYAQGAQAAKKQATPPVSSLVAPVDSSGGPPPAVDYTKQALQSALTPLMPPTLTGRYDNGDSDVADAQNIVENGYENFLGRGASPDEINLALANQGLKTGDKYVGANGLNYILQQIANSPEAQSYRGKSAAPAPVAAPLPVAAPSNEMPPYLLSLLQQQAATALPSLPFAGTVVNSIATRNALKK